jgi:uncharacterized protein DUF4236
MGFFYRKSIGIGPFRVNISKSGVGYSVGGRGFRTGVNAKGKRYTTFGIPGTGIGYRANAGNKRGMGCLVLLVGIISVALIALIRIL